MSEVTPNPEVESLKAELAEATAQLGRWQEQLVTSDERLAAAEAAGETFKAAEIRQTMGSLPEGIHRKELEVQRLQEQLDLRSARLRTEGPAVGGAAHGGIAHGEILNQERKIQA